MNAVDEPDDHPGPQHSQGILALPTELIHTILLALPPLCIEHFSQTCKLARRHVYGDANNGDPHLWKRLYLERFDDFAPLWQGDDDQDPHQAQSSEQAISSVMSLVQTRDRAARLFAGDPSSHTAITLNFNAVLSALLSVIDTAVPNANLEPCRNFTWLDNSVLSSGQPTWSQWVFPRSLMHSLGEHKSQALPTSSAANASQSPQAPKRRRLSSIQSSHSDAPKRDSRHELETKAPSAKAGPAASSSRPSSSSTRSITDARPDTSRRRSARLLKLIYPVSLHPLVDQGIDIDALANPNVRLAARIHCLHGIRAWKDSQTQRLTASPQEIPGQRNQDGLAAQGATQASAQATADAPAPLAQPQDTSQPLSTQGSDDASSDGDDDDQDSFDEPPAAILGFRPRMFGPSFGFCNAPEEEDQVRARMRHRVYDSGHYGWSNAYAPLHAWRYNPRQGQQDHEAADSQADPDSDAEHEAHEDEADLDDVGMRQANEHGSQDGDDDAWREAAALSDASDDIPDDPIPIEIEVSADEDDTRTFRVADRYGNPIGSEGTSASAARGWDVPDDEHVGPNDNNDASNAPGRTPYQPPDQGAYDADTRTYTYEGHQPIGIVTGSRNIQVTVGDSVDFIASGELNIRFVRPGMLTETMRVTSGNPARRATSNGADELDMDAAGIVEDDDEDMDDDYDEDAEEWDDDDDQDVDEDDDDGRFGPFFDMFRPLGGAWDYRGCYAVDEIQSLIAEWKAEHEKETDDEKDTGDDGPNTAESRSQVVSLRCKTIHWELVEAIMVVMYANLKEAIWLENWGVGIRIPKVYDDAGVLMRDPMERREFLEFPTGWISSLSTPLPLKANIKEASDQADSNTPAGKPAMSGADDDKPHDWARCESFWAGTYAFLDYSHFVDFNVRMARRRREQLAEASDAVGAASADGKATAASAKASSDASRRPSTRVPSLVGQEEAVGDCLQLRVELLPKSQQPVYRADEEGQEEDEDYPTLYFRGTTVTYWGNEAPMPRGGVHGKVRPVYAREDEVDSIVSRGKRGKKKVEGLHWSLTHVYDGEDRWQLEGIQPGPPGTRAPIFGIWSDAVHEAESPNGPFVYWMMDERPWKEIERLNREEAQSAAAARAARQI